VEDEVAGDGDGGREKKVEMGLMGGKMEPLSIFRKSYRSPPPISSSHPSPRPKGCDLTVERVAATAEGIRRGSAGRCHADEGHLRIERIFSASGGSSKPFALVNLGALEDSRELQAVELLDRKAYPHVHTYT
jgi:hypothetical protein